MKTLTKFFLIALVALLPVAAANAASLSLSSHTGAVYLLDGAGALVDFSDNPTASSVGSGTRALAWNPVSGDLYSNNSDVLWLNNGTGWTSFADLSSLGLSVGAEGSLAIGSSGEIAVADAAGDIFLLDSGGSLIDFSGNPTASSVGGGSLAMAWDPITGTFFTHNSSTLWSNDGTGWNVFANLFGLGLATGSEGSLAIGPAGEIAVSDNAGDIFLLDGAGALIDFAGNPTASAVGSGALALAWDPVTGDLFSHGSSTLWSNDGSGWTAFSDLAGLGLATGTEAALTIVPEPASGILLLMGCAILSTRKRR